MTTTNPHATTINPSQAPPLQQQQHMYQTLRPSTTLNPNRSLGQGAVYRVASFGRGFIYKQTPPNDSSDKPVTVANQGGYPPRPTLFPISRSHFDNHQYLTVHHQHHMIEPPMSQQHHQHHHPQIANPSIRGLPVSSGHHKVVPSPSPTPDSNGYTHLRDKRDGTIAVVRDRKPLYGGSVTLSSPLPMPTDSNVVEEKENEEDDDETDKDENLYQFSDLLRRHVQRAKRIRARLNDERAKRIERYKTRLSLLLPPLEEESWNHYYAGN